MTIHVVVTKLNGSSLDLDLVIDAIAKSSWGVPPSCQVIVKSGSTHALRGEDEIAEGLYQLVVSLDDPFRQMST